MGSATRPATIWVVGNKPQKRHLLDCDYFDNSEKLQKATAEQMMLPQCQWCVDRMTASLTLPALVDQPGQLVVNFP